MGRISGNKKQPTKEDVRAMQLEIDKLAIQNRINRKNIMKMYARIRTMQKGKPLQDDNRFKAAAKNAHIEYLEACIDMEYVKIEINKFNITAIQNKLDAILAQEPEPILRREQLPPNAQKGSPPLFLPPDPPRIARR